MRFDVLDMVATTKLRWMRKLDTSGAEPREVKLAADERAVDPADFPQAGCQVELTQIVLGKAVWWSFSFEAFGKVGTVERDLRLVAALMAKRKPPELPRGTLASYPTWLADQA